MMFRLLAASQLLVRPPDNRAWRGRLPRARLETIAKMNHILRTSALFALLLPTAPAQGDAATPQKQLLSMSMPAGKSRHHSIAMDMTSKMNMGGQEMNITFHMTMFTESKFGEEKDGACEVTQTIYRLKVKADGPMQADYDSEDEKSDPGMMLESLTSMLNKPFTMKMNHQGKVSDVKPPEGLDEQVLKSFGDANAFEDLLLPKEPIGIGESWETTTKLPLGGDGSGSECKVVNKLTKVENGKAYIDQEIKVDPKDLDTPAGAGKLDIKKSAGKVVFDLANGSIDESVMQFESARSGDVNGGKMEMQMNMTRTMKPCEPPAKKEKKQAEAKGGDADKGGETKKGDGK
jgi:Family of unknown function (DUF6263)